MGIRTSDTVPISEARARLIELAEDVVRHGAEKVRTKNGASDVALVDARQLDRYHALEAEHAPLVMPMRPWPGWRMRWLAGAPASGRPARSLDASSVQGQALALRARQLAATLGARHLREAVPRRHLLLYAHSDSEVCLLALKHARQLADTLPAGAGPVR